MDSADFVVVGGGSAGCALAGRLSENGKHSVILVEAGQDARAFINRMPAGSFKLLPNPEFNWLYKTQADPTLADRESYWVAGRILGGGSGVNGSVYTRGGRHDYDGWAADGCTGWGWNDVLPYFLRAEDYQGATSASHHRGGPLAVSHLRSRHPLADTFVDACKEAGFRKVADYCSGDVDGAFINLVTQKRGERWSAARAFIEPADGRSNLTVLSGAMADKVIIEDGRAVGVRVLVGGEAKDIRAGRDVIVCAGSLASPAILMRSGIGPGQHLQDLGIPVVQDSGEVGQNLREHPSYGYSRLVNVPTYNVMLKPASMLRELAKYVLLRRGMMTASPVQAIAFLRSSPDLAHPDIKLAFSPMATDPATQGLHAQAGVTVYVIASSPRSTGEVRLASPDGAARPLIDHRLLSDPADVRTMTAGVRHLDRIFAASSLARHTTGRVAPAGDAVTDDALEAEFRASCTTGYQPIGTCRMGGDIASVVDPQLRVRGVTGLRVADASILPSMPTANTSAPAMMIGERAADFLLKG